MNDAAFEAFYARVAPSVRAYLVRSVGRLSLADDLLQEAFFRFLRSGFEGESEEHRKRYLFRIATNLTRDHFRSPRSSESQLALEEMRGSAERSEQRLGARLDLAQALEQLDPRDRQMLWLAHVEGLSHRELARVFDLSEGSSRVSLHRARKRLAQALEPTETGAAGRPG